MKKTISLILCAMIMLLSLTGCSSHAELTEANVQWTVDKAFAALADFNTADLEKYVDSSTLSVIMKYAEKHKQFSDLGKAIFSNLTYEITDIDLENKTVTVSVNNKDLFNAANEFANRLKSDYSTFTLLSMLDDESFLDRKLNTLCEEIENSSMFPSSTEITLSIEQDKKNLVLAFDDKAENAVSGNALRAVKSVFSIGF